MLTDGIKQTNCKNIQFAETFSKYVNMIVLQNIEEFRNYPLCRDLWLEIFLMTLIRVGVVGEIHEDYKIILVVNFILP